MSDNTKKISGIGTFAILSLYLVSMGFTVVTPAMATLAGHFEGKDVSWFSTLPTLFIVIGTFVAGQLMGKKLSCKSMAIIGTLIALIFGCAPALFDNYTGTLICRAAFGFGMGFMSPLGNALIVGNFEGQKQASLLGYGTLCMNGGGIVLQMLGGMLAAKSWQLTFWGHLFMVIALIMAFFLPELPKAPAGNENAPKEKLGSAVWLIAIMLLVYNILSFPVMMNLSVLFVQRGAGDATVAATTLSLYTVFGCIAGFLFGQLFKMMKKYVIAVGFVLTGTGALLVYLGSTSIIMTVGVVMLGFGFSMILPACMVWAGMATPPSTIATASAIILALMNLGGFLSSFWLKFMAAVAGDAIVMPILVECIVFYIFAVLFFIRSPFKEK